MKPLILILVSFVALFFVAPLFAAESEQHEHRKTSGETSESKEHAEERPSGVGAGKAVVAATKDDGIQLSDAAKKTIDLRTEPVVSARPFKVPRSALVYSQGEVGLYRLRGGWFKFVEVKVIKKDGVNAFVGTEDLAVEDAVVVHGADLLKLADLNVWSGGEGGE